ncbi:MAG: HIT family protein [Microthrixaceae bacterium]
MDDCVFCEIITGQREAAVIAFHDDDVVVIPARDQRPTNLGHMLVVTRGHYRNIYDLPPELDEKVWGCVRRVAAALQREFGASGTTIRLNNEPPGQDVFHLHVHVIPRHLDDENLSAAAEILTLEDRIILANRVGAALG